MFEQLHGSLKRMQLDYVDIFYCHCHIRNTVEETLRTIDDMIRQGKVLYAGVSMWTVAQIEEAVAIAVATADRIIVNQPAYNMLDRTIEAEIIPVSEVRLGRSSFHPWPKVF